ncbi:MAG: helix-turn-helix transcriptional regulator [Labilithrix sp.]
MPSVELTAAEREVLGLLREGLSNEEIAQMRSRSARTVANQVAALLRKTGTRSRAELASLRSSPRRRSEPPPFRRASGRPPGSEDGRT